MTYGAGGRALAMGGAFFSVADDASASYWNPAGLAQLQRKELMAMQATLFGNSTLSFLTYAHPTAAGGTYAFNITQLSCGGFEKIAVTYDPGSPGDVIKIENLGSFSDTQRALGLAWGRQITDTVSLGTLLKRIQRTLDNSSDSFATFDLSAMKQITPSYRLAVGAQNVVGIRSGDTDDKLPLILKFGNSLKLLRDRFVLGMDMEKGQRSGLGWHMGGEYWVMNWWAVRFGIQGDPGVRETDFGFGLRYSNFGLDLAQAIHDLGSSTRFSASLRFGQSTRERSEQQIRSLVDQGFEAFRQGNFILSMQQFRQALDVDPSNAQVKAMLGRLQGVIGYVPQATAQDENTGFVRKGVIAYVDGRDLKASVNSLRYAFNKTPQDEKLLSLLNLVEKEAGVSELTRKPEGPEIFSFIDQKIYDARQAIYQAKYDLAIRRAQDVLDLESQNTTALEIMGSAFFLMEEKEKAKAIWRKVLEIDPSNKVVPQFLKQLE